MKIIKAKECNYCGVHNYEGESYLVFRTKFDDLEWLKECKYVSSDGNSVYYLRLNNGKVSYTPTEATKVRRLTHVLSMELSQNLDVPT